ncbi:MAG: hypothetical protein H6918_05260 [Sphingomonadaceae bacterium]|nr:hypothetical protein [Sphingomonadaceae bacterium]
MTGAEVAIFSSARHFGSAMEIWNMKLKNTLAAMAAMSLVAAPVAAQAAPLMAGVASQPVKEANNLKGEETILVIFAVAAVIAGLIFAFDGGNDDPVSS